jgi:hypothetical protein
MQQVIHRLEAIHRALRNAPKAYRCDPRVADSVAICLRELHAIAAQSSEDDRALGPRLRLIDCRASQGSGITTQ